VSDLARQPAYLTLDELIRAAEWKMHRGGKAGAGVLSRL